MTNTIPRGISIPLINNKKEVVTLQPITSITRYDLTEDDVNVSPQITFIQMDRREASLFCTRDAYNHITGALSTNPLTRKNIFSNGYTDIILRLIDRKTFEGTEQVTGEDGEEYEQNVYGTRQVIVGAHVMPAQRMQSKNFSFLSYNIEDRPDLFVAQLYPNGDLEIVICPDKAFPGMRTLCETYEKEGRLDFGRSYPMGSKASLILQGVENNYLVGTVKTGNHIR